MRRTMRTSSGWRTFVVLADSPEVAQSWGDVVVQRLCSESRDVFVRSTVEAHVCAAQVSTGTKHACPNFPKSDGSGYFETPVVVDGQAASADYIGW